MDRSGPAILSFNDPFPGLPPFQTEDSRKFFGRESQIEELLDRLGSHRFVAVVGDSGCGKSSLVRAGLMPALNRGFLRESTSRWRFAVMRPGAAPVQRLASALQEASIGGADILSTLSSTSRGLGDVVAVAPLEPGESLLLIVDQFEELFRYAASSKKSSDAEARLFVGLLLDAVSVWAAPIYVVLTMRSEFLGQCAKFPGLPEMLNRSQYLVPLLGREQRQDVIVRPLRLVGVKPDPALVQELLNASSQDSATLPVLQHALARTYQCWRKSGTSSDVIGLKDYDAIGGIAEALKTHGDALLAVAGELRPICERLFRALTVTTNGTVTRRPTSFEDLKQIVGATEDIEKRQLAALIRLFAQRRHAFLTLWSERLGDRTIVDITHESLIWFWPTLERWVKEEARSSEWYAELMKDVVRHRSEEVGLWTDPQLERVLEAKQKNGWNSAWATQYASASAPSYSEAIEFLDKSVERQHAARRVDEEQKKRTLKQQRTIQWLMLTVGALMIVLLGFFTWQFVRLRTQKILNDLQTQKVNASQDALTTALQEKQRVEEQLAAERAAQKQGIAAPDATKRIEELTSQQTQKDADVRKAQERADAAVAANTAASADQKALTQRISDLQSQLQQASLDRQSLADQLRRAEQAAISSQVVNSGLTKSASDKSQQLEAKIKEVDRLTVENTELKKRLEQMRPGSSTSDVQAIRGLIREYLLGFPTVENRSTERLAAVFPDYAKYDDGRLVNTLSGVDNLALRQNGDAEVQLGANNTTATADVMIVQSTRLKGEKNTTMESRGVRFTLQRRDLRWVIVSEARR